MHAKLKEAVTSLISEGWSELQDQGNPLPMRQWGSSLLSCLTSIYGETSIIAILEELYEETYKNEDQDSNDNF